jgi:2-oxoglutarate ferredoxin oxidoreductase subunit delta
MIDCIIAVTVAKGYIEIDQEFCKGCQLCISFCPKGSIYIAQSFNAAGYQPAAFNGDSECTGCAICALVCPEVAIEVYRD